MALLDKLPKGLSDVVDNVIDKAKDLPDALDGAVEKAKDIAGTIGEVAGDVVDKAKDVLDKGDGTAAAQPEREPFVPDSDYYDAAARNAYDAFSSAAYGTGGTGNSFIDSTGLSDMMAMHSATLAAEESFDVLSDVLENLAGDFGTAKPEAESSPAAAVDDTVKEPVISFADKGYTLPTIELTLGI